MTTAGKDNLTRDEAQARAALISSPAYSVSLDLAGSDPASDETFACDTTITFTCSQPGATTFIDADATALRTVELNGKELKGKLRDGRLELPKLEASNTLRVQTDMPYSRTGTGLHRFVDPVDQRVYAYTQFEPFDAHRAFPCFDQPDIKGTFAFDIRVPEGSIVVSNMRPAQSDGGTRWVFPESPVMSTYLAAVCVGPFQSFHDKTVAKGQAIDLGWYCRESLAQYVDADELFEITKQGFAFFSELFDYPYMIDSYDQVFCPEYKFGAMENLGCVTYTENFVFRSKVTEAARERRAEVILHEMSHMWFGDLVTMRWWNDLWLNESFATYMAYLAKERATRFKNSWVTFASDEKSWAYKQDQLPTTHPIVADIPDVEATHLNFDGITYAKGASVLKQLVAWVGEDAFAKGLRTYFKAHEYRNTELGDFLAPLAAESGRDLGAWSNEWLETAGVNSIKVDYTSKDDAFESFAVVQEAKQIHPTIRPHRMAIGLFDSGKKGLVLRKAFELDVTGERTEVAELAGEKLPDLVLPNHLDLAYAKIRFDERSLRTLTERLRDLTDPLARTLCWGAAWDMVRDAELPARRYVELVLNNAPAETDIGVLQDLLNDAGTAIDVYGDPDNREDIRAELAATAYEELEAAKAGSDQQLIWGRAFISHARADEDVEWIRGLLDGTEKVKGLKVDIDLRWHIVTMLAANAAADDELIDAELGRDPTDQGQRYAAAARASRPDPTSKAQAWAKLTTDANITLAMLRAVAVGFNRPSQDDLLAAFADRYFSELLPFWSLRGLDLGLAFTAGAYPRLYSEDVVAMTDELLERKDVPPPVRRLLIEAKDETARAIRAREADRAAS